MATKTLDDAEILLKKIGNTPLVKLDSLSNNDVEFYAKLEFYNPFGSVKDRAAFWMVKIAEENGVIKRGHTIIIEQEDYISVDEPHDPARQSSVGGQTGEAQQARFEITDKSLDFLGFKWPTRVARQIEFRAPRHARSGNRHRS